MATKRTSRGPRRGSRKPIHNPSKTYSQLLREVAKAEEAVGKYISRSGVHYGQFNAYQLDSAIQEKRQFAVNWRSKALALGPDVEGRTEAVRMTIWSPEVPFKVFSIGGVDRYAVAPSKGSSFVYREVSLDEPFKAWATRRGWKLGR